jgi:histidinol-phosphatase (PHP family)
MTLPPDNHVHTEFSWDAHRGSMRASCQRAVEIGLPSIAFTEHVDMADWAIHDPQIAAMSMFRDRLDDHNCFAAPPLDVDGYFESIDRCRSEFPELRILTGLEIGEPHWFADQTDRLLASGEFERVLGSLHTTMVSSEQRMLDEWYSEVTTADEDAAAVRSYLAESIDLVRRSDVFEVFAHIDYLTRQIELVGRHHDPSEFEAEYRETLRAVRDADRVLEINTRRPLEEVILRWWYDEGGVAVSFGSDAHEGTKVGAGFRDAAAMAEAIGFRQQPDPLDFWRR